MDSDIIDAGCEREQKYRDMLIQLARIKATTEEFPSIGRCYNCHEPVAEGSRYCPGPDCRDDHTYRMNAARRAGRLV